MFLNKQFQRIHTVNSVLRLICLAVLLVWVKSSMADGAVVESAVWHDVYDKHFQKYTTRFFGPSFNWRWFKAQAIAESSLNNDAASPSGAIGVMQILPSTYHDIQQAQSYFGDLEDAQWNIAGGIFYNRMLFRKWKDLPEADRLYLAFASYNAGYQRIVRAVTRARRHGAVRRWEQIKAYVPAETRAYVERIRQLMEEESRPLHVAQLVQHDAY